VSVVGGLGLADLTPSRIADERERLITGTKLSVAAEPPVGKESITITRVTRSIRRPGGEAMSCICRRSGVNDHAPLPDAQLLARDAHGDHPHAYFAGKQNLSRALKEASKL
jgi:hypothetical protein